MISISNENQSNPTLRGGVRPFLPSNVVLICVLLAHGLPIATVPLLIMLYHNDYNNTHTLHVKYILVDSCKPAEKLKIIENVC